MNEAPLLIVPRLIERIWGRGDLSENAWDGALHPPAGQSLGEAWLTDAACMVEGGGTLGAAMARDHAVRHAPPLLAKLLFTAAPLSAQAHPTDAAARAAGTSAVGKDEAWHVLWVAPGTRYRTSGRLATIAGMARMACSIPLPGDSKPKVSMTIRPAAPNSALWAAGGISAGVCGMPCGITVMRSAGTP